jgi:NAD(P)-dependent dehydrogenase (short-subunit alcohol dehydrogenase family)
MSTGDRTYAITGAASGMGAATTQRLRDQGHRVITVDQRDADIVADLGTPEGRARAVAEIGTMADGRLEGFVPFAGVGPLPDRKGSLNISVNYFGSVEMLDALRPLLAAGDQPAAVAISSNSTTCQPGVPLDLVDACLAGDEAAARDLVDTKYDSMVAYPASKIGVARWVRSHAVQPEWAGAGITLNAVAPGMIDTPMVAEGRAHPDLGPLLDAFTLPIGRPGRPEEIAALVGFLLGPDARNFCGSLIFCDGGTDALIHPHDHPSPWTP